MRSRLSPRVFMLLAACGCTRERPLAETLGLSGERWSLSGLTPPPGAEVATTLTMSVHDGELLGPAPLRPHGTMSMEIRSQIRETYVSTSKIERVAEEDRSRFTGAFFGQKDVTEEEGVLVGLPVIGEATETGGWTWRLQDGLPTDEQREALADLEGSTEVFPTEPVGVGDVWFRSAADLLGGAMGGLEREGPGLTGSAWVRFARVGEHNGEPCAELEMDASDVVFELPDEPGLQIHLSLYGTSCVSMTTGVELVQEAEGWWSLGLDAPASEGATPNPMRGAEVLGIVAWAGSATVTGGALAQATGSGR